MGLPQVGKLANDLLTERLAIAGYYPCQFTTGLWKHVWWPIFFTLVVDNFGVIFVGQEHANHLRDTLECWYDITADWEGRKYIGISLNWNYDKHTLGPSVPGFVMKRLT